ncbi:MAG TPA: serine/threonine-protein kinase [Candidatus Baltobacteraceae bacterium]|jgi:streptogramin lyase|nr:serine/threonine-protein kinase [Candidatus Baltobacteraceae bacterium]
MSNEPSNPEQTVFVPPVSAFAGPIAELVGHQLLSPPTRPGLLAVLSHYEVLRVLGSGGMGVVLLARDIDSGGNVAVKMVRPELVANQQIVHRFVREAGHLQKLKHKNVVPVLEVSDRAEGPYFVMPYFDRGSVAQRIKPGQPLDGAATLEIALQVAGGLQFAHRRGIIHRDLKPANILLRADGRACLADFGLARTLFNDTIVDVEHEQLEGTAPYMSPGVAAGNAEDTRCDIYAFGGVLYEMLTGEPPYVGRTTKDIRAQILAGPPKPVKSRNPEADTGLAAVAEGAMARELRDRYADMSDVLADLERINQGRAPLGPRGLARRVRRIPAGVWVPAILILLAVVSRLAWPGSRPPPAKTPAAPVVLTAPTEILKPPPPATPAPAPTIAQNVPAAPASTWVSPVIAGQVGAAGSVDGIGADARFRWPRGIAIDKAGNLYVADTGNNTIRKITPDHTVMTLAGLAGSPGALNGKGGAARFIAPQGITVDTIGNVYVAEFVNNTVRRITPDGIVSLLAGSVQIPGSENGRGAAAHFRNPWALAADKNGNVYVSDNGNLSLRKITPEGVVITLADSFGNPRGVAVDSAINVYVADLANNSIRKITSTDKASTLTDALSAPENVAVDGRGFVYVTDSDGIHKISPDGKQAILLPSLPLTEGSFGPVARAEAIAVDAEGTVYIADSDNNVICRQSSQ